VRPLVFNATLLVYLTKVGLSRVFEELKDEKLTSLSVKREVVDEGKRRGFADVIILDKLFLKGVFKVVEPRDKVFLETLLQTRGLHVADAEVLTIAKEHGGIAIIDDDVARKMAKIYGISYAGTPYILAKAVFEGIITKERAKQAVNDMVFAGWRCSIETYAEIMETIEKLGKIDDE
jgi:predicted nucleic acid-binding protein